MRTEKKTILNRESTRAAALFLLGIFFAAFIISFFSIAYLYNHNAFDHVSTFEETEECRQAALERTFHIAEAYYKEQDNFRGFDNYRFQDETNLSVSVYDYETKELLYQNFENEETTMESKLLIIENTDTSELYYNFRPTTDPSAKTLYEVVYTLSEDMQARDYFFHGSHFYSFFYQHRVLYAFCWGLSLLLFAADLIYLLVSAGRTSDTREITLSWFDRIPFDIVALIILSAIYILSVIITDIYTGMGFFSSFSGMYYYDFTFSAVIKQGIRLMALLLCILYFAVLLLLSAAARIKAGTFLKNNLISMCLSFLWFVLKQIPLFFKTTLFLILYWIIFYFIGFYYDAHNFFQFLLSAFSIILTLTILYELHILSKAVERIKNGDLDYEIPMHHLFEPFRKEAENLEAIRHATMTAVEKQVRSERLKTELITNVSHDIKTPLTSIINYIDLLKKAKTPEEKEEYLTILSKNSSRLKKLIEDLIEASKASTGNIPVHPESAKVNEIIQQALAEYEDKFEAASLQAIVDIEDPDLTVWADGRLLWRVLSNLLSNCVKYAQPDTRVYIHAWKDEPSVSIEIKNISKSALNISPDELMERFVRGESSRTTEGSGLGLNIAKSLTEIQNGTFDLAIDGDLFKAIITLPIGNEEAKTA